MIKSFRCPATEKVFDRRFINKFPVEVLRNGRRKLEILNAADRLEDLKIPPGNRLEPLMGNRRGQHSIRINDQWRVCFVFRDGNAYDVEITKHYR